MNRRLILFLCFCFVGVHVIQAQHIVRNPSELKAAVKSARPGDVVVMANGVWNDVTLVVHGNGTAGAPIVVRAETPGKVIISGTSMLKVGGEFLTVKDLYFRDGVSPDKEVISFRIDSKTLANNSRVTGIVVDNFNPADKMKNDNWLALYGKNNRVDHCTFINKSNLGPTLVVKLDDDRSRENLHQIDSNYFKGRLPLGVNGGETIRIGVSDHSLSSSRTSVIGNYFERCNGEVEIISVKSGHNVLASNTFFECEGNLVLRHGNENVVERNLFLGNGKPHTGGVRVINRGHRIYNNVFKDLTGDGFRSSLAVMNGVFRSPLNRYHRVQDVDIHNNTFINCHYIEFGVGRNEELTLAPENVRFRNNLFCGIKSDFYKNNNTGRGVIFTGNLVIEGATKNLPRGFRAGKHETEVTGPHNLLAPTNEAGADLSNISNASAENTGASWFGLTGLETGSVTKEGLELSVPAPRWGCLVLPQGEPILVWEWATCPAPMVSRYLTNHAPDQSLR